MNRTRFLLAALVVVVLMRLYPDKTGIIERFAVAGAALYGMIWGILRLIAHFRRVRAQAAQEAADEREYRQYKEELDSLRAASEPRRDPDDLTSITPEYQEALTRLHDKHEAMLTRKFGPRS